MAPLITVDLLVFGPHPDDIEIGFGGTIAVHAGLGFRIGLCDLTRGELGSNGTPEEREREAEAAPRRAGRILAGEPGLAGRRIDGSGTQIGDVVWLIRQTRSPYCGDSLMETIGSGPSLREAKCFARTGFWEGNFPLSPQKPGEACGPQRVFFLFFKKLKPRVF